LFVDLGLGIEVQEAFGEVATHHPLTPCKECKIYLPLKGYPIHTHLQNEAIISIALGEEPLKLSFWD
jgi:hypothetical protein